MKSVDCGNNINLSCLNLKNNSNGLITYINTNNNFILTCIEVDDSTFASNNPVWTSNKDPWSSYSENCAGNCITSSLNDEQSYFFTVYPNPCEKELFIKGDFSISNVNFSDLSGKNISTDFIGHKVYLPDLISGMYLLQIITEEGQILSKKINVIK